MKKRNWFWGTILVLAAVLLVASQFAVSDKLGAASILVLVVLAGIFISSLVRLKFVGITLPLALAYNVLQGPFGLTYIKPWVLVGAALLLGIGLSVIFRRRPRYHYDYTYKQVEGDYPRNGGRRPEMQLDESGDDNHPFSRVKFGAASRYLHSTALENGQFEVNFGALEVYFDQATLQPEGAEIWCDVSFGALKLYVPRHWRVEDRVGTSVGGVNNDIREARAGEDSPRLTLVGNASFGAVEVYYV